MKYKDIKIMYENFKILPDGRMFGVNMYSLRGKDLQANRNVEEITKNAIEVTAPIEKGYIYAANFLYLEIEKEIERLRKTVKEAYETAKMQRPGDDNNMLYSAVVVAMRQRTGDDQLIGLIKDYFAKEHGAKLLTKTPAEVEAIEKIREKYAASVLPKIFEMTIDRASPTEDGRRQFTLDAEYVDTLTQLQKLVFSPTLKLCGYSQGVKIEEIKVGRDFTVTFNRVGNFDEYEKQNAQVKKSLKELLTKVL